MTMNTSQIGGTESTHIPLGAKLQTAREAMRLDRKEAAAQLRLAESVIDMMENNAFPDSMPQIFIRGYIRAYGKLLQLPEDTILAGLEPVRPRVITQEAHLAMPVTQTERRHDRGYAMKGITIAVAITLVWLMAAWWNNRTSAPMIDNVAVSIPAETATTDTNPPDMLALPSSILPADSAIVTDASTINQASLAIAPNLNTTPATNTLPAGISIAQPTQRFNQTTPVYTPSANTMTSADNGSATSTTAPDAPIPSDIPAYKRAAMASNTAHHAPVNRDNSDE